MREKCAILVLTSIIFERILKCARMCFNSNSDNLYEKLYKEKILKVSVVLIEGCRKKARQIVARDPSVLSELFTCDSFMIDNMNRKCLQIMLGGRRGGGSLKQH